MNSCGNFFADERRSRESQLQTHVKELEEELSHLKLQLEQSSQLFEEEKARLSSQLQDQHKTIEDLKSQITEATSKQEDLSTKLTTTEDMLRSSNNSNEKLEMDISAKKKLVLQKEESITELNAQLEQLRATLIQLKVRFSTFY